jgi:GT2 family glycosyltransferase
MLTNQFCNGSASGLRKSSEAGNLRACELFAAARQAFDDGDFALARRYMQGYRNLVRYEDFPVFDGRTESNPLLSIIVVTYNTKPDLLNCLNSVYAGSLKQIEVIVVDNGGNAEVLPALFSMPLAYVRAPMNLLPSEARNVGVSMAKAPVCAFLDDDALAGKDFCRNALLPFTDPAIRAIRGKVLPKTNAPFLGSARHYDLGENPVPHVIDTEGNSAWKLDEYRTLGGMDPLLFGHEGTDLSYRLARKFQMPVTFYWPPMLIYHDYAVTEKKSETKELRHKKMHAYLIWKQARHEIS